MEVSVVGVGTWQFGGEWGKAFTSAEAATVLDAAREAGITLVDTAECYGDHLSERLVGQAIRRDRERWVVATKFGHRFTGHLERAELWSPDEVKGQLEDSLKALQTDYVDLYQFHSGPNAAFDNPALWEMLAREMERGRVRHLGISISGDAAQQEYQTRRAPEVGAEAIQVIYNRLSRLPEQGVLPSCLEQELGVLARVPLASGFLSGKYSAGARFGPDDVRASRKAEDRERLIAEAQRIHREEVPAGVAMSSWALAWCLSHRGVSCVIPGCKSAEQVRDNARAADLTLPPRP